MPIQSLLGQAPRETISKAGTAVLHKQITIPTMNGAANPASYFASAYVFQPQGHQQNKSSEVVWVSFFMRS